MLPVAAMFRRSAGAVEGRNDLDRTGHRPAVGSGEAWASQAASLAKCPLIADRDIMPSAECYRLALSSSIQALTRAQSRRVLIVHRQREQWAGREGPTGTSDATKQACCRAEFPCHACCSDQLPAVVGDGAGSAGRGAA